MRNIISYTCFFSSELADSRHKKKIIEYGLSKLKELKSKNINCEAYFNGSKSIHVHILFSELRDFSRKDRERYRELIINKMGNACP